MLGGIKILGQGISPENGAIISKEGPNLKFKWIAHELDR